MSYIDLLVVLALWAVATCILIVTRLVPFWAAAVLGIPLAVVVIVALGKLAEIPVRRRNHRIHTASCVHCAAPLSDARLVGKYPAWRASCPRCGSENRFQWNGRPESVVRERGAVARELAIVLPMILVLVAACVALAIGADRLGWPVASRIAQTLPFSLLGFWSLWIAWQPSGQREAEARSRFAYALRGVAWVIPAGAHVIAPEALSPVALFAVFFGGMVLSFIVQPEG